MGKFSPEEKRDPDASQDIHFSPFHVPLILTNLRDWDNMDQLAHDELQALNLRSYHCK